MTVLHGDFETRSACDLKKCGADVYARHPSTEILCFGFAFEDGQVSVLKKGEAIPERVRTHIESGATFVAHNAAFELAIWNFVCVPKYGWPPLKVEQCECTMAMAYAMALPGSLEKSSAAMGITKQKDMAGSRIMLQLAQPRAVSPTGDITWWEDEEKFEKVLEYCRQDVLVEHELYGRLLRLSNHERKVWILDQKINQRGVQVDLEAVKVAITLVESERKRLDLEMRKVTGNAVATCNAAAQLKDWLSFEGVDTEKIAKADVLSLLKTDLPKNVKRALELRQEAAKSSTAKLQAMLNSSCEDKRIRGIFQYHGAGTGRWAGRRIQPQNFPRPSLNQDEIENVFHLLKANL